MLHTHPQGLLHHYSHVFTDSRIHILCHVILHFFLLEIECISHPIGLGSGWLEPYSNQEKNRGRGNNVSLLCTGLTCYLLLLIPSCCWHCQERDVPQESPKYLNNKRLKGQILINLQLTSMPIRTQPRSVKPHKHVNEKQGLIGAHHSNFQ